MSYYSLTDVYILGYILGMLFAAACKAYLDGLQGKEENQILCYLTGVIWPIYFLTKIVLFVHQTVLWCFTKKK